MSRARTDGDRAGYLARRLRAMPHWQTVWEMRQGGMRYREIAQALKMAVPSVFKMVQNYDEHRLELLSRAQRRGA